MWAKGYSFAVVISTHTLGTFIET